jgi:LemA protein
MEYAAYLPWVVAAAVLIYAAAVYNNLVRYKNRGENAFAQIDVQLKRRYDLIPNLVETARGYLTHERETLEAVTAARNSAQDALQKFAANISDKNAARVFAGAEAALGGALSGLQVAVEAYPDLKASANMTQLSEELTATENKVAFARQSYNDLATHYNTYRQSFPPLLFASVFGHGADISLLEFEDKQQIQQAPKVSF